MRGSGLKAALVRLSVVGAAALVGVSLVSGPAGGAAWAQSAPGAAIGEIPQQEAGSAAGLSHETSIEATTAEPQRAAGPQSAEPDAPPADIGLAPDVRPEPVTLDSPEAEPATVRLGEPAGMVAGRSGEE